MKKKKPKLSQSAHNAFHGAEALIKQTIARLSQDRLPPPEKLAEMLDKALEKLEAEKSAEVRSRLCAELLETDFAALDDDAEEVLALYEDVADFLLESLEECSDEFAQKLLLDLVRHDYGSEARHDLYEALGGRLAGEALTGNLEQLLDGTLAEDSENSEEVLNAVSEVALGAQAFETFERAKFALDEDRSNGTLLEVATEYLNAKKLDAVRRLLSEVQDPVDDDLEDYLDLKAALADAEGNSKELRKLATELYEKFPTETNLVRLGGILPAKDRYDLLVEHGKFRLGSAPSVEFMFAAALLKEFGLLDAYITHIGEEALAGLDAGDLTALAEALEKEGEAELARRIRNWIVEEPTDLRE